MDERLRQSCERTLGRDPDWASLRASATYRPVISVADLMMDQPAAEPYEELDEIGRGGMGIVYRCRQKSLDRVVAVKRILGEGLSNLEEYCAAGQDFLAEAFVSGRLEHPNIPPVYDLLSTERGEPYMAMKLIEGQPWSERLAASGPDELVFQLETLLQVSNAVAFAHSRSIVHLDLKPENVMIGSYGEVLVMDWGLAVAWGDAEHSGKLRHASSIRSFCGTPSYMAPELANGRGEDIGPWTDIYLLGAILYEILYGQPPHWDDSFQEVMLHAADGRLPAFDKRWPADLRTTCRRALAAAPGDRHPTVQAFQEELRTYLEHRESLLISGAATARLARCRTRLAKAAPGERNALYDGFASAVAGFAQARTLWPENPEALRGGQQASEAYARAALQFGDLGLAESHASRLQDSAALDLDIHRERRRLKRQEVSRRRLRVGLAIALCALVLGLTIGLYVVNGMRQAIAREKDIVDSQALQIKADAAEIQRQRDAVEEARARAEQRGSIAQSALDNVTGEISAQLLERGDERSRAAARRVLDVAMAGWEELREVDLVAGESTMVTALTRFRYGQQLWKLEGRDARAQTELEAARELYERHLTGPDSLEARSQLALVRSELAELAQRSGDSARALAHSAAAIALLRPLAAREDAASSELQRLAATLQQHGRLRAEAGALREARELYAESVALHERILEAQGSLAKWMLRLGVMPDLHGDPLSVFLDLAHPERMSQRLSLFGALLELGALAVQEEAWDEAERAYREALRSASQLAAYSPDDEQLWEDIFTVRTRLATSIARRGASAELLAEHDARAELARRLWDRARDRREPGLRLWQTLIELGEAALAAEVPETARGAVESARDVAAALPGEEALPRAWVERLEALAGVVR